MKGLDKFRLKGHIGLLLICVLVAGLLGNRAVYAKDQEINKESAADASDTMRSDEETKAQTVTDSPEALSADEKAETPEKTEATDITNENAEPLEAETIELWIWRGTTGALEPITVRVGELLLRQEGVGAPPETVTNSSGVTRLCEGWQWQMDGSLIDDTVVVKAEMNGKRITPKLHNSHTWTAYEEKAATCEEDGWTGGEYCSYGRCGIENPDNQRTKIAATGHSWSGTWTADKDGHFYSCQNGCGGKKDFAPHEAQINADNSQTCKTCAYTMITAHTHDASTLENVAAVAATCTEPAKKEHYKCSVCKKYFQDETGQKELTLAELTSAPALGHKFGDWTDIGNGKQRRTCSVCKATEERNKPAAPSGGNNNNTNRNQSGSGSSGSSGSTGASAPVAMTGSPQTADASNVLLWALLMLLSGSGAMLCIARKNRAR